MALPCSEMYDYFTFFFQKKKKVKKQLFAHYDVLTRCWDVIPISHSELYRLVLSHDLTTQIFFF